MRHPSDVKIRAATPDDVDAIADIIRRSYSTLPPSQTPVDMPIYHPAHHAEAMADPHGRWRLLEEKSGPAGVAMWRMLPGLAHLHLLFVRGDLQGRGYGSLLLRHFLEEAESEDPGVRLLTLHCLTCAAKTIRFYKRHGYTEYSPGDEGRVTDLYLWLDASQRYDVAWPLKDDKRLFYRRTR